MLVEAEFVRIEASSPAMVPDVRFLHDRSRIPQHVGPPLCVREEIRRRRLPNTPIVCGRYADRRTRPNQNRDAEEGPEPVLLNERYGSG